MKFVHPKSHSFRPWPPSLGSSESSRPREMLSKVYSRFYIANYVIVIVLLPINTISGVLNKPINAWGGGLENAHPYIYIYIYTQIIEINIQLKIHIT